MEIHVQLFKKQNCIHNYNFFMVVGLIYKKETQFKGNVLGAVFEHR